MAKRYTESEKWTKNKWFRTLPYKFKLFWLYLWDSVDFTGVYEVDIKLASFLIGIEYELEEIEMTFHNKFHKISNERWFIPEYLLCQYPYPKGINTNYPAVKSLRKKLMQLSLVDKVRELLGENYVKKEVIEADYKLLGTETNVNLKLSLNQPSDNVNKGLTDKDTDKDIDIDIDIDKDIDKDIVKAKKSVTEKDLERREITELSKIDIKKEYPELGKLKNQLTVGQMKQLLKESSVIQIKDAMKEITLRDEHIKNDSVYDSIRDYFHNGSPLPF